MADDYSDLIAAGSAPDAGPRRPRAPKQVEKPISVEEAQKISETVKPVEGLYDAVDQQPEIFAKGISPDALDAVNKRWGDVVKHGSAGELSKVMEVIGGGSKGFADIDDPNTRVEADNAWDVLKPMMLDKENKLNALFHPSDVLYSTEEDDAVKAGHRERLARKLEQVANQVQRDKVASGALLDTVKKLRGWSAPPAAPPAGAAPAPAPAQPAKPGLAERAYHTIADPAARMFNNMTTLGHGPELSAGLAYGGEKVASLLPDSAQKFLVEHNVVPPQGTTFDELKQGNRADNAKALKEHPVASLVGGGLLAAPVMAAEAGPAMAYLTGTAGMTPAAAAAVIGGTQAAANNIGKGPRPIGQQLLDIGEGAALGTAGEAVGSGLASVGNPIIKRALATMTEGPEKTAAADSLFQLAQEAPQLKTALLTGPATPAKLEALKPYIAQEAKRVENQLMAVAPEAGATASNYITTRSPAAREELEKILSVNGKDGDELLSSIDRQAKLQHLQDNYLPHGHEGINPNSAGAMLHPHIAAPGVTSPVQLVRMLITHPLVAPYTATVGGTALIKNNMSRVLQYAAGAARRGDAEGWQALELALKNGVPFSAVAAAMNWKAGPSKAAKKVRKVEASIAGD